MVRQEIVLRVIDKRTREGRSTSYRILVRELELSEEAACGHLERLWRNRLIASPNRPLRHKFRLKSWESIRDLRFRLAPRGKKRLDRYDEKSEEEGWL